MCMRAALFDFNEMMPADNTMWALSNLKGAAQAAAEKAKQAAADASKAMGLEELQLDADGNPIENPYTDEAAGTAGSEADGAESSAGAGFGSLTGVLSRMSRSYSANVVCCLLAQGTARRRRIMRLNNWDPREQDVRAA